MTVETATYLDSLTSANPGTTDQIPEGDDHIRLLKSVLKSTFPGRGGEEGRVVAKSAGFTPALTEVGVTFLTISTLTVSLPALAALPAGTGYSFVVRAGITTFTPNGSDTVNQRTKLILTPGDTCELVKYGTDWALLSYSPQQLVKENLLLNGAFDIWQRGASFPTTHSAYTADQWFTSITDVAIGRYPANGGIYGTKYLLALTPTSGTNGFTIDQPLPSYLVDKLAGKTVTLSFEAWTGSGIATIHGQLYKNSTPNTRSGGSWSSIGGITANLTTSPTRFSGSFTIPSDGSARGLLPTITGSNTPSGVAIYLSKVRLDLGSEALDSPARPERVEFALCQAWYELVDCHGQSPVAGYLIVPVYAKVAKPSTPTVALVSAGSVSDATAITLTASTNGSLYFQFAASLANGYVLNRVYSLSCELT